MGDGVESNTCTSNPFMLAKVTSVHVEGVSVR